MTATAIAPLLPPPSVAPGDSADVRFRQLRHHTKNALQTILNILGHAPELRSTRAGASLSDHLQERILLAAQLSDTLFGLTNEPGPFEQRLTTLPRCCGWQTNWWATPSSTACTPGSSAASTCP